MDRKDPALVRRGRVIATGRPGNGPVVYWMSRDQRVRDNWALLFAQQEALARDTGLVVVFCLVTDYPGAEVRSYHFLLAGLAEVQRHLAELNIGLVLLTGEPGETLPPWLESIDAHLLVSDFDPLRVKRHWQRQVKDAITMGYYEVDAHNVIPAWIASPKKEYSAATFRPAYRRLLGDYLGDIPAPLVHPQAPPAVAPIDVARLLARIGNRRAQPVSWLEPGETAARRAMAAALRDRLPSYAARRNDPLLSGQSGLSPYLHFGHLSPQRLAWETTRAPLPEPDRSAFLEEVLVRRELSDNFCLYEPDYDRFSGFPSWARRTLDEHRTDQRQHLYSPTELEDGRTHERLWNACQRDLVDNGKLHGYLRMYWAKKILEWSATPEEALQTAILLNDRYSLDGRDPNGYTGIAWSIGGVHDRAWPQRPVFGTIRYMNEAGCRRKFSVDKYTRRFAVNGF